MTNVDILLTKQDMETMKVSFNDAQNKPKEYPMKVALLNLKGLLKQQLGDNVAAKKLFAEAVAIAPDFAPAKENLVKIK